MRWIATLLVLMMCLPVQAQSPAAVDDSRVQDAIARMQAYCWSKQQPRGDWQDRQYEGVGITSLVTLALLGSGQSSQTPAMLRAIGYLRGEAGTRTYDVSLRAQVMAHLPDAYLPDLRRDVQWLVNASDQAGQWGYDAQHLAVNRSTTHFAALGLWEASRRDVLAARQTWQRAVLHLRKDQNPDGGWGYTERQESSGSMTAAGLSILLGAQQVLRRDETHADPQMTDAIDLGLAWLDQNYRGLENPPHGGWNFYYLFALERVALADGVRYFRQRDWFLELTAAILQRMGPDGSIEGNLVDTAFALIFLSRGRVPVWISKLRMAGQPTNRRPNDIYFLNQYLGRLREGEMNWQTIGSGSPLEGWLSTPVLYLASNRPINFNEQDKAALQVALQRGGVLLANPDEGAEPFSQSIRALAAELFPQWPMTQLQPEHPLYHALHHLDGQRSVPIFAVNNGVRDLIILLDRDLGYVWQADTEPGKTPSWKLGANLWALLTDRGSLPGRLAQNPVMRQFREGTGQLAVGRVRYEGNWQPEPGALLVLSDLLFNQHGLDLAVQDVDLRTAREAPPLLTLSGIAAAPTDEELYARLALHVKNGGTLLVETVGGSGTFARDVERRMTRLLNTAAIELSASHPLISGQGIRGGYDVSRVGYRHYAISKLSLRNWPRLAAIYLDNRPAVIFATEDLSLGVLDVPRWGVIGYNRESARRIMSNIMLWTHQRQQGDAPLEPRAPLPQVRYQAIEAERRTR